MNYAVIAIPLNRGDVIDFLLDRSHEPKGARLQILGQRPTRAANDVWTDVLRSTSEPTVDDLLRIDDPHAHLVYTHTDRLIPVQFLEEPEFLTRNLGGWSPVYFAVAGLPPALVEAVCGDGADDPLVDRLEVLVDFDEAIRSFGADPEQVAERLDEETGGTVSHVASSFVRLDALRAETDGDPNAHVRRLVEALDGASPLETRRGRAVPDVLLSDALMGRLVKIEEARRRHVADGETEAADRLAALQETWRDDLGVEIILKGEYVAGRHRRSTIVIAPSLGRVIKQPAPEPFHEIELGARSHEGQRENWPRPTRDGAVVTSRGRLRRVIEDDVVPPLHAAFDHGVTFSSLLGIIVEEHVPGPTVQEYVAADPSRMTEDVYERILATQQVCEQLGVENGDWHSANFIVREGDDRLVHIDWGAARPLRDDEMTPDGRQQRIDQVKNLAFSFQDDAVSDRVVRMHSEIVNDADRFARVQKRAERLANRVRR